MGSTALRSANFPPRRQSMRPTRPTTRPRCRTSACGTVHALQGHAAPDSGDPHLLRFSRIDIDRYQIDGTMREVMLAARELNVDKLPESSQNWINDKLIYTHGYGITMNPVNGFTAEGLPTLMLSNMPVQSTVNGLSVTRPGDLFWRDDRYGRLREDPPAGVQLSRRATQQPYLLSRALAASFWADFCAASCLHSTVAIWPSCPSATT